MKLFGAILEERREDDLCPQSLYDLFDRVRTLERIENELSCKLYGEFIFMLKTNAKDSVHIPYLAIKDNKLSMINSEIEYNKDNISISALNEYLLANKEILRMFADNKVNINELISFIQSAVNELYLCIRSEIISDIIIK